METTIMKNSVLVIGANGMVGRTLVKQLEETKKYELIIRKVAAQYQIPPALIAGIGSRESHWGLALSPVGPTGTGDNGHGRGLMQIDDRWHKDFIESEKKNAFVKKKKCYEKMNEWQKKKK